MDINQIKERIEKKEAQIAKIEKKITKWESNKSESFFVKDMAPWYSENPKTVKTMQQLVKARSESRSEDLETAERFINSQFQDHIESCDREIKGANRDLAEAKAQLEKYEAQLGDKEDKANTKKIKVIEDFLNQWEQNVIDYIKDNVHYVSEYYAANSKIADLRNNAYKVRNGEMSKEDYNAKLAELKNIEADLKSKIHPLSMSCYSRREASLLNMKKLTDILDKDKEAKYWSMVQKVEAITGEITDAAGLNIGVKGDLEGYIVGKNGTAHLRTVGAGGYNQGVIVNVKKGQMFHYRLIVTKVK